jgi:hypothetical protein
VVVVETSGLCGVQRGGRERGQRGAVAGLGLGGVCAAVLFCLLCAWNGREKEGGCPVGEEVFWGTYFYHMRLQSSHPSAAEVWSMY